jgi:hypothetical protein
MKFLFLIWIERILLSFRIGTCSIERICKMLGYDAPDKYDLTSDGKPVRGYVMILPSNGREVVQEDEK